MAPANAIFTPKMPACMGSVAPALIVVAIEEMERARHLAQGIVHRSAMVHEAVVERIHGPCGDRHVHERKREHAHRVQNGEVDKPRRVTQECERERREGECACANETQHARAVLVEKASGNGTHRAHHDGARQNNQARNGR